MLTFLPADLNGWLSLIVQFALTAAGAIAFVAKFIRKPLQDEAQRDRENAERHFKEHGERMGVMGQQIATNSARIETADRASERLHLTVTTLAERFGSQDTRVDRLIELHERGERERLTEDRTIGERLARIETKLDALAPSNGK